MTIQSSSPYTCRVYYADTDAFGVVYHARYLEFAERARMEWLRARGMDLRKLREEHNFLFIVRKISVDYQASARLDDLLTIETKITTVGGASLGMNQILRCEDKTLAVVEVTLVAITPEGKVLKIPEAVRAAFM